MSISSNTQRNSGRNLFGTSGIRGQIDKSLTPEFAVKVGLSFATLLGNSGKVLCARDVRVSSHVIQHAVISGLLAGGINVLDFGITSTPALLFALRKRGSKASVMVTGSHTPAPTTGMLFFLADTGEMDDAGEEQLENIFRARNWCRNAWNELGLLVTNNITEIYLDEVVKSLPETKGFRVVVDPGNGSACLTLGRALETLGCEVVTINGEMDGNFPSRSPYPQPSTLGKLSSAVKDAKADIGVGTDSDGDRAIFVTASGNILWGDTTAAIFAKDELKKHQGGQIITTVNTSSMIEQLCKDYGGGIIVTKVGPPAMAKALRIYRDAIFATEESGKYIWPEVLMYGDAAVATANLLNIMDREGTSLEQLAAQLPKMYQLKENVPCPDELKSRAMEYASRTLRNNQNQILTIDGLKVIYPDGSWFLLRPSGIEPLFRCYAESRNLAEAAKLLEKALALAQSSILEAGQVRS